MNKAQLIDAIAEKAGLSKADSKKALEAFVATIGESLKKDEKVALVGFGSFSVSERSARAGRNPQTGKTIQIPAKKVVGLNSWQHSSSLKDSKIILPPRKARIAKAIQWSTLSIR